MKVGIVGSGFVGSTAAFALVMRGIGREIVLVDMNKARAEAQADDILHAVPFAEPLHVYAGDYADLAGSRVVIITAGVNQQPGETRLQLLGRNVAIFKDMLPQILKHAPDAILLVATNPVDIMTHITARCAAEHDVPPSRVIGSGTTLDTARFRALLGQHLGVDSHHVHGYVVGEHGDSEVLTWSLAAVGGIPLDEFCTLRQIEFDDSMRKGIDEHVRHAAYNIIAGKGASYYGIGSALARIVDVILHDQRSIMTVCTPVGDVFGVCDVTISLPHLLGGAGILASFPLSLNQEEKAKLQTSAEIVCATITSLDQELTH
jgi:L-lactate dehydrogenase